MNAWKSLSVGAFRTLTAQELRDLPQPTVIYTLGPGPKRVQDNLAVVIPYAEYQRMQEKINGGIQG